MSPYTIYKKKKWKNGFMSTKLNMSKAYNHIECDFLNQILTTMGFDSRLRCLFMFYVKYVPFYILVKQVNNEIMALWRITKHTKYVSYLGLPSVIGRLRIKAFAKIK